MKIAVKYFGVHLILPEQAKYLATDMDGDVWWYEAEPYTGHVEWHVDGTDSRRLITTVRFSPTPVPWYETLKKVEDILLSKVS